MAGFFLAFFSQFDWLDWLIGSPLCTAAIPAYKPPGWLQTCHGATRWRVCRSADHLLCLASEGSGRSVRPFVHQSRPRVPAVGSSEESAALQVLRHRRASAENHASSSGLASDARGQRPAGDVFAGCCPQCSGFWRHCWWPAQEQNNKNNWSRVRNNDH